jgi:hypothetical protein
MRIASSFCGIMVVEFAWAAGRDWDSVPIDLVQVGAQSLPSTHCRIHWGLGLLHDGDLLSVGAVAVAVQRRISLRIFFACCDGGMSSSNSKQ